MGDEPTAIATASRVETILRENLVRENRAIDAVVPVLRHLLVSEGQRLVSDAILARVRGMLSDLAAQLLAAADGRDPALNVVGRIDADARDALAESLAADRGLLTLCHALAVESHLAERIHLQRGIDPVLSPLLQELIASDEPVIAELAMNLLAAQSRFIQSQRRMELPLSELPAELFHAVLSAHANPRSDTAAGEALARFQQNYDEATTRIGLLARLVAAMRRGAVAALALDHAGLGLFASTLAALSRQPRAHAVLACHEQQGARLALGLRAAGLGPDAIERQFLLVDPAARMPSDLAAISSDRARILLDAAAG
ncbi:hypothetical protein J3454_01630 [Erythrobacter sp. NFXS35]|uniref:hypothetical protein n=1 Tax=Erythrobacter sp. NFXS35 TaxID=2818436 RepID=UPI0032DFCE06